MKIPLRLLLVLLGSLVVINLVHAQSQQGFLNLACGMTPEDFVYYDPFSTLTFISDARFIDGGESRMIQDQYKTTTLRRGWNLRSFPQARRSCYNLNVTRGAKYLVKATFNYGNYDNRVEYPIFDLHIGPNKWATINVEVAVNGSSSEIIHIPTSNNLQVCLVKTGNTTPFITTLQLLPLPDNIYSNVTQNASLVLFSRQFLGNTTKDYLRFPDDIHDRSWYRLFQSDWNALSTKLDVDTSDTFQPPKAVMQMAATPKNSSVPLTVQWRLDPSSKMYVYMYFSEVEGLKPNETREFKIMWNGRDRYAPFSPPKSQYYAIYFLSPEECEEGKCLLQFVRSPRSTHPPLLNALEVYLLAEFQQPETDQNEVDTMKRIKAVYGLNKTDWQGDPCSPSYFLWEGLNCSSSDPPRITTLNLSSSGLTGIVSTGIQNLTLLKELDLSNNNLTGGVPEFLVAMRSLSVIDLSNNLLNGSIPRTILDRAKDGSLKLYVQGNPHLDCPSDVCKKAKEPRKSVILVVVALVALLLVVAAVLVTFLVYRKRSASKRGTLATTTNTKKSFQKDRRFMYSDILRVTNNLGRVLGRGGFGVVYHGILSDNEPVAVKILSEQSPLGVRQFRTEVELLLRVHHKNLVHLFGYCDEADKSALIYEYMANGDLQNVLSGNARNGVLSWENRVKIAAEAAQGLEYLHNGCKPPMIHRDIKTSNILLDENFQAKVADFGLSKSFGAESKIPTSTIVAGTPGYLDPEYNRTGWPTEKSDVYSFGVVLLEILTNQPVLDNTREGHHITEWVHHVLTNGDIRDIVDPRLRGEFQTDSVWRVIEVAIACVNPTSSRRPSMGYVAAELNKCLEVETSRAHGRQEVLNSMPLVLSHEFNPIAR